MVESEAEMQGKWHGKNGASNLGYKIRNVDD